jgi:hypothetical protein
MIIECTIRRKEGTKIDLFGKAYDFQPNEQGAHVAEVADEQAIERLLSITEAYREYGVQESVKQEQKDDDEPTDYLITNDDGSDLDLGKLEKEELIKFAEANEVKIDKRKSRDDLAKIIFEAVTA